MENTLIYDEKTDSLRQMPQNYIVAYWSPVSRQWVLEYQREADPVIMDKVIAVLQSDGGPAMAGSQLVQTIDNYTFPSETEKLKEGQEITINIPFTYTIGEEGTHTGKTLWTVEDCKNEVIAEVDSWAFERDEIFMEVKK